MVHKVSALQYDTLLLCVCYNFWFYTDVCTTGQIRLNGGRNPREGRVEICYYNQWGTICDDDWGTDDATVVCRQLGFSDIGKNSR